MLHLFAMYEPCYSPVVLDEVVGAAASATANTFAPLVAGHKSTWCDRVRSNNAGYPCTNATEQNDLAKPNENDYIIYHRLQALSTFLPEMQYVSN